MVLKWLTWLNRLNLVYSLNVVLTMENQKPCEKAFNCDSSSHGGIGFANVVRGIVALCDFLLLLVIVFLVVFYY